jgi:hypothetical protein
MLLCHNADEAAKIGVVFRIGRFGRGALIGFHADLDAVAMAYGWMV